MKKLGASIVVFSTIFTIEAIVLVTSNQYKEATFDKAKATRVVTPNQKSYDLGNLDSIQKVNDPISSDSIHTCIKKNIDMKEIKKKI